MTTDDDELEMRVKYRIKKLINEYGLYSGERMEYAGFDGYKHLARIKISLKYLNCADDVVIDDDGTLFYTLRRYGFNVNKVRIEFGSDKIPTCVIIEFECSTNPVIDYGESRRTGRFTHMKHDKVKTYVGEM